MISEGLWIEAQKRALDLRSRGIRVDASQLTELGLRILLVILQHGRVPDDLAYLLEKHDPEALEKLLDLLAAKAKPVRG